MPLGDATSERFNSDFCSLTQRGVDQTPVTPCCDCSFFSVSPDVPSNQLLSRSFCQSEDTFCILASSQGALGTELLPDHVVTFSNVHVGRKLARLLAVVEMMITALAVVFLRTAVR